MVKTIGLDLDNTVFDLEPVYKLGFKGLPQYKYTCPTSWAVYECYPKIVADRILNYFRSEENYLTPLLNKRYPDLIKEWQKKYQVKVITSRRSNNPDVYFFGEPKRRKISWAHEKTFQQIWNAHMYISIDDIIMTTSSSKLEAIKKAKVDLMIDDSPIVIEECLNAGVDCVMVSTNKTPYNHYLRNKVEWVKNLFEVQKIRGL